MMKLREAFVYFLMACGIGAAFGGFALVSRGQTYG